MSQWIQDSKELAEALASIGNGPVAIDLEADSFHHYHEKVCLVQISFGGLDLLVDPLAGTEIGLMEPVLRNRSIRKIFHGADYDLRLLNRDFELAVAGLFDTMIAARLTGESAFGLAALLDRHLGIKLDKAYQRADWSKRPLPGEMLVYAVEDTRHLEELSAILESRLRDLGRTEWAGEEFRLLEEVRWNGAPPAEDAWLRIKGARKLDRRGLTVVRELHLLRDETARKKDVPPFRVFRDAVLVDLAARKPDRIEALREIPGLPRPFRGGRGARALLAAVERGVEAPAVDTGGRKRKKRQGNAVPPGYGKLREHRDRIARDLGLDPTLLASRKVLESLLERTVSGDPWRETPGLRRWQAELLEEAVEGI